MYVDEGIVTDLRSDAAALDEFVRDHEQPSPQFLLDMAQALREAADDIVRLRDERDGFKDSSEVLRKRFIRAGEAVLKATQRANEAEAELARRK